MMLPRGLRRPLAEPGAAPAGAKAPSRLPGGARRSGANGRSARLVAEGSRAKVHFEVQRQVAFGETHKIVGSAPELGSWDVDKAPLMQWNEGDVWTLDLDVDLDTHLEFKCVKVGEGLGPEWEGCNNRGVQVHNGAGALKVGFAWSEDGVSVDGHAGGGDREGGKQSGGHSSNGAAPPQHSAGGEERPEHLRWQGKATQFMRSNQHSRERQGRWDVEGLQGAAAAIVRGDEKAANWLDKMRLVHQVLVDDAGRHPELDATANAFIYLQWISTGAIECKEGGGHYRPNKHAELARSIFRGLERAIGDSAAPPLLRLLARKTQAKLPSFSSEYTQSTPLTRIRDIAHRNDIPHELKQEIKHTIQNKLHRNAGPEDLVATEALLQRVTDDGGYSEGFVGELRTFAGELRDFFSAGSLAEMLEGLQPALDGQEQRVLQEFLEAKGRADGAGQDGLQELVSALHALTSLRANLLYRLSSGLRNDANDSSLAMRQRFRLCELRSEEYAFTLLSRLLNLLEGQGGAEKLANGGDGGWALPLGATVLAIRQLGLGDWRPEECLALENELGAWQQAGGFDEPQRALRLKATLERVRRLTQSYTDGLLSVLPPRSQVLGNALGIEPERVQVFTEGEIRASLVFQLSKLSSLLLSAARTVTGAGAWDALVAGKATGRLVEVESLDAAQRAREGGPLVLLVRGASGDEEVVGTGLDLRGVILGHGLPHLSHLGVRARQEKLVFVAAEDDGLLQSDVRPLLGKTVTLTASGDSVRLAEASEAEVAAAAADGGQEDGEQASEHQQLHLGESEYVEEPVLLQLEEAQAWNCGAKAAACAELARLAADDRSFAAPPGVCLPFGSMELALWEDGRLPEFDGLMAEVESTGHGSGKLDAACKALQDMVHNSTPPWKILMSISAAFEPGATLIVRSSANVEDLAGLSGAGLYESVANVKASDSRGLADAISRVWASLYTRRAILSRRSAGVPEHEASMAVLIQQQVEPELSFVLHTRDPLARDEGRLVAELAVGLGETLASGTRGSPWRLAVDKRSGKVTTQAFANFSEALGASGSGSGKNTHFGTEVVDYSKQALSTDEQARQRVGKQLAEVGGALERAFGGPQDVEGGVAGREVYVVQTRPQP